MGEIQLNAWHRITNQDSDANNVSVLNIAEFEKPAKSDSWKINKVYNASKCIEFLSTTLKRNATVKERNPLKKKSNINDKHLLRNPNNLKLD